MEIIKAQISNKSIRLESKNFGNKFDNSITKIVIDEIEEEGLLDYKYVAFLNPKKEMFLFPLNSEDNSFTITLTISQYPGAWKFLYLSCSKEIKDGTIDECKTYVSNSADFTISDNFLNDEISSIEIAPELKPIYQELEETIIFLNGEEFQNELIENLHISESDIETITNNLKNDEEFKESVRGEKGDAFTYEDFTEEQLEALRGPEGPVGPAGPKGDKGSTYEDYCEYHTFMNDNLPIPSKKFYLNDEILLNTIESLPDRTEIFRTNRFKYYFNSQDGLRIFWYGLDVEVTESNWWADRLGFIFIHREQTGSETDLWYFDNGQATSDYCFEDANFNTMVSNPYLVATRTKILPPEEFAAQFEKGLQGDDGASAYDIWYDAQEEKEILTNVKDQEVLDLQEALDKEICISKVFTMEPYGGCIVRFLDSNKNPINPNDLIILYTDGEWANSIRCKNLCYLSDLGTYVVGDMYFNESHYEDGKITLRRIFEKIYSSRTSMYQDLHYFIYNMNPLWKYIRIEYSGVGFNEENVSYVGESVAILKAKDESYFLESLQGSTGPQGVQGVQGEKGEKGEDGESAYETWLEKQPIEFSTLLSGDYIFNIEEDLDKKIYFTQETIDYMSENSLTQIGFKFYKENDEIDLSDDLILGFSYSSSNVGYIVYSYIYSPFMSSYIVDSVRFKALNTSDYSDEDKFFTLRELIENASDRYNGYDKVKKTIKEDWKYIKLKTSGTFFETNQELTCPIPNLKFKEEFTYTEEDFIEDLRGEKGEDGKDGESAFETWLELQETGKYQEIIIENEYLFDVSKDLDVPLFLSDYTIDQIVRQSNSVSFGLRFINKDGTSNKDDDLIVTASYSDGETSLELKTYIMNQWGTYQSWWNYIRFNEDPNDKVLTLRDIITNTTDHWDEDGWEVMRTIKEDWEYIEFRTNGEFFTDLNEMIIYPMDHIIAKIESEYTEEDFIEDLKPKKGIDYYTEEDKQELKDFITSYINQLLGN